MEMVELKQKIIKIVIILLSGLIIIYSAYTGYALIKLYSNNPKTFMLTEEPTAQQLKSLCQYNISMCFNHNITQDIWANNCATYKNLYLINEKIIHPYMLNCAIYVLVITVLIKMKGRIPKKE